MNNYKELGENFRNALSIAFVTLSEGGQIDDVTATENMELFAKWANGITYKQGNIREFEGKLYKCLQGHTSQTGWEPDKTPALWKEIGDPTEEFPNWSQPVGAGDGYPYGAKVSHNNGKHYISRYNGENCWEPGLVGNDIWEEV